jgi:bacterioferritin
LKEFLTDVTRVQARVREEFDRGLVREERALDRTIYLLNQALALNYVCVLRHMRHFVTADRFEVRAVAQEFLEQTVRESEHSDLIAARIKQLGGELALERESMASRGHFICDSAVEFEDVIRIDLEAERIAIETYDQMISCLAVHDPTSSQLLQRILSLEEEHAAIMLNMVVVVVD